MGQLWLSWDPTAIARGLGDMTETDTRKLTLDFAGLVVELCAPDHVFPSLLEKVDSYITQKPPTLIINAHADYSPHAVGTLRKLFAERQGATTVIEDTLSIRAQLRPGLVDLSFALCRPQDPAFGVVTGMTANTQAVVRTALSAPPIPATNINDIVPVFVR